MVNFLLTNALLSLLVASGTAKSTPHNNDKPIGGLRNYEMKNAHYLPVGRKTQEEGEEDEGDGGEQEEEQEEQEEEEQEDQQEEEEEEEEGVGEVGDLCSAAAFIIDVGDTVEGQIDGPNGAWYSILGTGRPLAVSTCTDNDDLNIGGFDTIITVYSGDCNNPTFAASDDDGGSCGNLKSTAYFETVAGETYYVNVMPFGGVYNPTYSAFGLTVFEVDETNFPDTPCQTEGACCETASSLELDQAVAVAPGGAMPWFTFAGTGGYLSVTICSDDGSQVDIYGEVSSGACNEYNPVASIYGYDSCSVGYLESAAGATYNLAMYVFSEVGLTITVSEETDIPNTICPGATPLELDQAVEGEILSSGETQWYTLVGTGRDLVISTCTENADLNSSTFDSVIEVHARDCDDLRFIVSDDEGGKCGNGKSAAVLPSVNGLVYKVAVREYHGGTGAYGLVVSEKTTDS